MSHRRMLRQDHISSHSGPVLTLGTESQTIERNGNNGLLRLDLSFLMAPWVSVAFLNLFVDKPFHILFKELRNKTYVQEAEFLANLLRSCKDENGMIDPKWADQWKKIFLSMCTQCALENYGYHPFLEQEAKQWLKAKFQEQGMDTHFNDRWEALRNEYHRRAGWPGPFYFRNDINISFSWAERVE